MKERQRGVETCSAKEQPSFLTHLPCLLSLCQPGAVSVCVFWDVNYTVGVEAAAGSGAGCDTQGRLCASLACPVFHGVVHSLILSLSICVQGFVCSSASDCATLQMCGV